MADWIRSDFNFGLRGAVLIVGQRDVAEVFGLVKEYAETPEKLADMLRVVVEKNRPDLKGLCIWSMNFSPLKHAWEIMVEHPSLPPRGLYEQPPEQPLRPEYTISQDYNADWVNPERNLRMSDMADVPLTVK